MNWKSFNALFFHGCRPIGIDLYYICFIRITSCHIIKLFEGVITEKSCYKVSFFRWYWSSMCWHSVWRLRPLCTVNCKCCIMSNLNTCHLIQGYSQSHMEKQCSGKENLKSFKSFQFPCVSCCNILTKNVVSWMISIFSRFIRLLRENYYLLDFKLL